jgi:hypothetical protein
MVLGSTQPLTEMSTRNLPGGKDRPARDADSLIAICEPTVYRKFESLDVSQPYGPPWPVIGVALPFFLSTRTHSNITLESRLLNITAPDSYSGGSSFESQRIRRLS